MMDNVWIKFLEKYNKKVNFLHTIGTYNLVYSDK